MPSGVPIILLPLIVVIEIISYLSRPISLSVRLFANMMAGHTMMKVFGGFVVSLGLVGGWLPLGFSVALTGLEILVAFLQAYVFAILTCIYLNRYMLKLQKHKLEGKQLIFPNLLMQQKSLMEANLPLNQDLLQNPRRPSSLCDQPSY